MFKQKYLYNIFYFFQFRLNNMKAVVQRVAKAKVTIEGRIAGEIGEGLLVLLAMAESDTKDEMKWMANKLVNLRVFPDEEDKMNRSVLDIGGGIMLISNFTIYGDLRKGFRPNFMKAAPPDIAEPLYNDMLEYMRSEFPIRIAAGEFGAMMDIELINSGPVTVIIEKENTK
ncbi:MAG: D-aminoacyl-tRNA deacylase [Bacteroidota bacterium]|nr:D-aminoacyl-tRNA deacylase [Bacteroidota bacterium]